MVLSVFAVVSGLAILGWSAGLFVDGASLTARYLGMPPLLIGMVIVGFGTSAPEMLVSALSAIQGSPGIALGNAYGSNIVNIALILGVTALVAPVAVHSRILRSELPVLAAVTALAAWQLHDRELSRTDAGVLLAVFGVLVVWSVLQALRHRSDSLGSEMEGELEARPLGPGPAILRLVAGLALLIASCRLLVWGAVEIARTLGLSDLVIGLTIVAIGTSLPELASSIAAIRKNEPDIAFGNVLGSNLFNTLAVAGIAGVIQPGAISPDLYERDILTMGALTISLFLFGYGFRGPGRINRFEGGALLGAYIAYTAWLLHGVIEQLK
ncbi:MAG: calcium/sodium antiporter [Deltaproteobacteria bacterium]|nr:calcium/sodium antiporter [Deltaproteobacteria bacterium]